MPPKRAHTATNDGSRPSSSARAPSNKKTRFLEPDEDPTNFAADVDAALETHDRKGRVKTEGYDSDSSDDGEGVVFSRRKNEDGGEDDDDMFAMAEKEDKKGKDAGKDSTGGKDKEEFLRLGDIEGQEFGEGSDGDEDDSVSEDEPEDEDDAERRKKAGMGYEISHFNMRDEMEEGKFSADGTFVRTFDPHAMHDRWLDGVDEREMKKARRQKRHLAKAEKERLRQEEKDFKAAGGTSAVEIEMLGLMKKGETVVEALQRLGARAKKDKTASVKKKAIELTVVDGSHAPMAVDSDSTSKPKSAPASDIERLTHLASTLMSLGDVDIYNRTFEHILRSVRSKGNVEPDWVPPSAVAESFEYKWDVPDSTGPEGEVFGPYSEEDMKAWFEALYFGAKGEKVKVRRPGEDWGSWDEILS